MFEYLDHSAVSYKHIQKARKSTSLTCNEQRLKRRQSKLALTNKFFISRLISLHVVIQAIINNVTKIFKTIDK